MINNNQALKLKEFPCQVCGSQGSLISYYGKLYPWCDYETIENPIIMCEECYVGRKYPMQIRGGNEQVYCIEFDEITQKNEKCLGWLCSDRSREINHLAQREWRKKIFRIHYLFQASKKGGKISDNRDE